MANCQSFDNKLCASVMLLAVLVGQPETLEHPCDEKYPCLCRDVKWGVAFRQTGTLLWTSSSSSCFLILSVAIGLTEPTISAEHTLDMNIYIYIISLCKKKNMWRLIHILSWKTQSLGKEIFEISRESFPTPSSCPVLPCSLQHS